jgi:hypothetical protein
MRIEAKREKTIPVESRSEAARAMVEAAATFLASLSEEQRRNVQCARESKERFNWDYRPRERSGIALREMDSSQQKLFYALLASGLSRRANIQALGIMSLEKILQETERSEDYDPDRYHVTLFGIPSGSTPWGWRIEGHHVSVNILIVNGSEIAATPNFFGANPARAPQGPLEGFRVLGAEEDSARELLLSLDGFRRSLALIATEAPADILTRWEPRVKLDAPLGLPISRMTERQKKLSMRLISLYTSRMPKEVSDRYLERIDRDGIGYIHFAWAGSDELGKPHYYRLHGPSFLVEYDNIQNNANHIHTVWRDLRDDWGEDLLKSHYAISHRMA